MSLSIENSFLQFVPDLRNLSWSLDRRQHPETFFENVRMKVSYQANNSRLRTTHNFQRPTQTQPTTDDSPFGHLNLITLADSADNDSGLRFTLTFALPDQMPCLLWKLKIENLSTQPVQIGRIELMCLDCSARQSSTYPARFNFGSTQKTSPSLAFFSNGWQSWNYTGVYGPNDHYRSTRLGPFTAPMRVNAGIPRPKTPGHLVSDMFAVLGDRELRQGALTGFLSQQQQFGMIETHLRGQNTNLHLWAAGDGACLDPGGLMNTDWAYLAFINLDDADPFGNYFEAVARQHGLLPPMQEGTSGEQVGSWPESPTGWCSWYNFFSQVSADDIRRNLQAASQLADRLPLEVIQIDDGFETKAGDWFSFRPGFPNGMAPLAEEIRAAGFKPGVWLAPFILVPESTVAVNHPDWLLHGRFNRPVNAGYTPWGEFSTALDLTHPEALNYAQEVVHTAAQEWGFSYLKLDFLYAGALSGKHRDPTLTRAQILRKGLQALRDCVGQETTLLGCGCPLGPAIGLVDAMRIGADVSDRWKPAYSGVEFFFEAEPDYPSTRNALQNILTRSGMHQRWWINDPDCLLIRPETRMTLAEVQSLATAIALSGGSFFLSDDLPALPDERIQLAASLLPPLPGRMRVIDWFDSATPARLRLDLHNQTGEWSLLAFFNWQDDPVDLKFEPSAFGLNNRQAYWIREYWQGKSHYLSPQDRTGFLLKEIDPHGVRLLAVRPAQSNRACYLGSSLHVSQGLEVTGWENDGQGSLKIQLARPARSQGEVEIYLPGLEPRMAVLNAEPIQWQPGGDGRFTFYLDFDRAAEISLAY
jgi:alpha-galactosidase